MKISREKRDKICEQILSYLYSVSPKPIFTSYIAKEIARDEEFTKDLLEELKKKFLVKKVKKNPEGMKYLRRTRWQLSREAYKAYKQHETNTVF